MRVILAAVIVCALTEPVLAKVRPTETFKPELSQGQAVVLDRLPSLSPPAVREARHHRRHHHLRHHHLRHGRVHIARGHHHRNGPSLSLAGLPGELVAKVKEIETACGSRVISVYRPGARVRGSGHLSLHAVHKAADVAGNPRCIYAHLRGWPGGYSIDYGRVAHVHISYEPHGREWGVRFAHWQPHHHRTRYARAHW